jgi:aryl-alcohol dehydrogenase-like predicted oxidoreductase
LANVLKGILRNVWRALVIGATSMEQLGENINAFNKAGAVT